MRRAGFGRHRYRGYRHHKSFSPWYEMRCWFRAGRRKLWYRWQQRHMLSHITEKLDNQYYPQFCRSTTTARLFITARIKTCVTILKP